MRPMSILSGAGPVASMQARLGWWLLLVAAAVVVVVAVLVLMAAWRARGGDHRGVARSGSGLRWLVIGGMIVPAIVLTLTLVFTVLTENATAAPPSAPAVTVDVIAHRWWWELRYVGDPAHTFTTANELHVPVGQPVRIRLTSFDVVHSFWVPQLAGKLDVIPGQQNTTWIQADSAGVYRGTCAEYCGLQHAHMALYVIAEPPARYAEWARTQIDSAKTPSEPGAAAGLAVFQKSACAACHAIRGADALGRVGPDLTHVASRLTLAAGALDNTRGNLAGWIANAQAIKPGTAMPTMTSLRPAELQALLAYLETLK